VASEERLVDLSRRLRERRCVAPADLLFDRRACAGERAVGGADADLEGARRLLRGEPDDVTQEQGGALRGGEHLKRSDEREGDAVVRRAEHAVTVEAKRAAERLDGVEERSVRSLLLHVPSACACSLSGSLDLTSSTSARRRAPASCCRARAYARATRRPCDA